MTKVKLLILFVFLLILSTQLISQQLTNYFIEDYTVNDTCIQLKHYPIHPNSLKFIYPTDSTTLNGIYVDEISGKLLINNKLDITRITISYKAFQTDFHQYKSDYSSWLPRLSNSNDSSKNENYFNPADLKQTNIDNSRLKVRGSIARGVNIGNNQNAVLNSNLNMQIEGDLGDGLMVNASISDRNIPIQPDGSSQQLQDFDQVYIEVYNPIFKLTAGDFTMQHTDSHFLKYQRKAQGAMFELKPMQINDKFTVKSDISGAAARGKYHRMTFNGEEGNQGPYKLSGANNESWIIVLSGSERIYIDGVLLTRGQSQDYIIDYNTGELTFTANQLITKDTRIIAEYEYSDRNYNRFSFATNHEISSEKSSYFIRYYSDSDAKNQPVDQNIDTEQRLFLSQIRDNSGAALYPSFDSVGFDDGQVRYTMTDSLVNGQLYDSIFIYSVDPQTAVYQVSFALVGDNQGDYVKLINSVNGRVYQWVAPVNGVPQGNYAPVSLLITPKKQQMLSLGGKNELGKRTNLHYELALSNNDLNLYSDLDAQDDQSLALNTGIMHDVIQTKKNTLNLSLDYNYIHNDFQQIENFRTSEFSRDWNLNTFLPDKNEHSAKLSLDYQSSELIHVNISSSALNRPGSFEGYKQDLTSKLNHEKWNVIAFASLLNTKSDHNQTQFLKHQLKIGRRFNHFEIHLEEFQEWNQWTMLDSLLGTSYQFQELKAKINQGKASNHQWEINYKYRLDKLPWENQLFSFSESHDVKAKFRFLSNQKSQLDGSFGYRDLKLLNQEIETNQTNQNSLTAQVRYNQSALNDFIQARLFYQSGAGLELKKEFTYIEVPAGQGVYQWIDYNGDGTEDLDEFEIAQYSDEAKYIRIYTPGQESIRTFNNQLSMSLQLRPEKLVKEEKSSFIQRFHNQFSINLSNKNTSDVWFEQYTPMANFQADSSLVHLNNSIRNTLSFNRFNQNFSADLIYHQNQSNTLLINGLDVQSNQLTEIRTKIRIVPSLYIELRGGMGLKSYNSDFFDTKNYAIKYEQAKLDFVFQPSMNMRLSFFGEFKHKENQDSPVFSRQMSPGVQYRNNALFQGMISVRVAYTYMQYNGEGNSSLAYQMLEALQVGNNYNWTLSFQKRLANGLQINLNYQGRKPADSKIIHTGGLQVRAYF